MPYTLITGASGGIGECFARELAARGHDLVLVARSENKLHQLCDELMLRHKVTAHYVALDLTLPDSVEKLWAETEKHKLEIAWLINNAGFGSMGEFTDLPPEKELQMIVLNISVLVALTHLYLGPMRERKRGTIINVSSTASYQPIPFMATYAATKAFVTSFTEAIAEENKPYGIYAQNLCPGATETNFFAAAGMKEAFTMKGIQTSEQVVAASLRGVERGQRRVISGLTNKIVAYAANAAPNSLVTKTVASILRSKVTEK